ncbi:MAG: EpsG family protein [Carnobacterium sp.]|nr:EpsG family protein [Carnobacterium sp.]
MSLITNKEKTNTYVGFLFFLIWPFLSFIISFKKIGSQYFKTMLILFFGFFGYTYIYNSASDSSRYASNFDKISQLSFNEFLETTKGIYSTDGAKQDIFLDIISFIISRFIIDTRFFFMTLAIILGYLLLKNIQLLKSVYLQNRNSISLIFLIFFIVLIPPSRILSFRHYAALLVFIYGVHRYFKQKNIQNFIIIFSSVFFHFSFIIAVFLFIFYQFIGNRNIVYYILIMLSFLYSDIAIPLLRQISLGNELLFNEIILGYTNEEYLDRISENQENRLLIINSYIRWTTLFFLISLIIHRLKSNNFDLISKKFYSFSLLFFVFVNFTRDMEYITNRFGIMFQLFACLFFIYHYFNHKIGTVVFQIFSISFLILYLVVLTRITIEYANLLIISPFFPLAFMVNSDYTILDLIR